MGGTGCPAPFLYRPDHRIGMAFRANSNNRPGSVRTTSQLKALPNPRLGIHGCRQLYLRKYGATPILFGERSFFSKKMTNPDPPIADYGHEPVMLAETIELLHLQPGQTVIDCTLGRG